MKTDTIAHLKHQIDSIGQQLALYAQDAKHYDNNLSQQTAIFACIITIILIIIGFGSYRFIIKEVKDSVRLIKKQFDVQKGEFENQKIKSLRMEFDLLQNMANTYVIISHVAERDKFFLPAFKFFLNASLINCREETLGKQLLAKFPIIKEAVEELSNIRLISLSNSKKNLKSIIDNKYNRATLEKDKTYIIKYLDELLIFNDDTVKNVASEIRTDFLRYFNSLPH